MRERERREVGPTRLVSAVMMPSSGQRTKSPNVFAKHFYTKTYQIQSSLINAIDISFTKERKKNTIVSNITLLQTERLKYIRKSYDRPTFVYGNI